MKKYFFLASLFFLLISCRDGYMLYDNVNAKKNRFDYIDYDYLNRKTEEKILKFPYTDRAFYITYYPNGQMESKKKIKMKIGGFVHGHTVYLPYGTHKFWNEKGELIRKEKYSRITHELKKSKTY